MSDAQGAPLAKAHGGLVVRADMFGASDHRHRGGLPKSECVDRPRGPMTARFAMAITHRDGFTVDGEFDGPAEATRLVISHVPPPSNGCQFHFGPPRVGFSDVGCPPAISQSQKELTLPAFGSLRYDAGRIAVWPMPARIRDWTR